MKEAVPCDIGRASLKCRRYGDMSADEVSCARRSHSAASREINHRKENPMPITVIAKLKTKAGSEKAFEDAARKMIETMRSAEPNTLQYVLHKGVKDPTEYVYYEVYPDQAALDAHGKTDHMKAFGGAIGALLDGRPQVDILHEVTRK
jgi:quinol monooxygenase YgiN